MSDYAPNINTNDYIYRKEIIVTEMTGNDQSDLPVKLSLNATNFNFSLARSDGKDIRIGESSNGSGILEMWVAAWHQSGSGGTIWFKIPKLLAYEAKKLYVYWGNLNDVGISDIDSMGFFFADGFDGTSLDTTKWYFSGAVTVSDSKIQFDTNAYIEAKIGIGDLCIGGTITSANTTNPSNIFDDNESTYGAIGVWGWVGYEFTIAKVLGRFRVKKGGPSWYDDGFEIVASKTGVFSGEEVILYTEGYGPSYDWEDYSFANNVSYKYVRVYNTSSAQTWNVSEMEFMEVTSVFSTNWLVEDGLYLTDSAHHTNYSYYGYRFYGTENEFGFNFYGEGDYDRQHNVIDGSTWIYYDGVERGLEGNSYSNNYIVYYESVDRVYQGMQNRNTFVDYNDSWERKVEGDTRMTYFRIYGRNSGYAPYVYIDWVIISEYFAEEEPVVNTNDLYVPYEIVNPQPLDFTEYNSDVTNVNYYHQSSFGGDPYKLSNGILSPIPNCWYSDADGAIEDHVDLIIDFGRRPENLVHRKYTHYDDGHVQYLNASKLSDNSTGSDSNTYFQSTTTSGYVCIDFDDDKTNVGCLAVKGLTADLDGMVKNFVFMGSDKDPRIFLEDEWTTLYTGEFEKTSDWQVIHFINNKILRYYKLKIIDTYGNDIVLQEWQMFKYYESMNKKVISQLRLHPVSFDSQEICFPKQITLYGSDNMVDWSMLTSLNVKTYTPFYDGVYERWQRYSFDNIKNYWCYKLRCKGNWNSNLGKIAIAEWEMVEKHSESCIYRIFGGSSNNFNSIWAISDAAFDKNNFFVVNEGLNVISDDKLAKYTEIPGDVLDLNVMVLT